MKRCLFILLTLALLLTLAACAAAPATVEAPPMPEPAPVVEPPPQPEPFPGKIAIITNAIDQNEEDYRSGQQVVGKYGTDKVVHVTWPANFMQEQEQMIEIVADIAADPDVKALIINQAVPGTNAAVTKLRQIREDIFVVYCEPQEEPAVITELADLVLEENMIGMGPAMAQQAYKMGAKKFIHYSFPRHMGQPLLAGRRDLIEEECAKLGIEFVYVEAPDPTSDVGVAGAAQYWLENVPKMLAQYGADTAFFSTLCGSQIPLIKAVSDGGGIYPQPCHPSPYHGFPAALGIDVPYEGLPDINYVIDETTRILGDKGVLGRFSTWPVPAAMMNTNVGVEYAVKWMNCEVPKEGINVDIVKQLMEDYAGVNCTIRPYSENGVEYENYFCVSMDYLTYGEEYIKDSSEERLKKDSTVPVHSPSEDAFTRQGDLLLTDGVLIKYDGQASNITLPDGITSIGEGAFSGCTNLEFITIPDSVQYIGKDAFFGCSNLSSITIPESVTSIGYAAFKGCVSLESITIPDSVTSIEVGAFSGSTRLKSITIPNSVTSIEWGAFSGCSSLKSVNISRNVTSIEVGAFSGLASLKSITIPDSVTSIGWGAFTGCSSLESIAIPASVTSIDDAFRGCLNLTIHCPANSAAESYAIEHNIPYVIE